MDGGDLFPNLPQHQRRRGNNVVPLAPSTLPPTANRIAILAFLNQPRTAKAVADHIGRHVVHTVKRLDVLVERGLAVTYRDGLYVRTKLGELKATTSRTGPDMTVSGAQADREKVLAFLVEKRAVADIATYLGQSRGATSHVLTSLANLVVRVGWGVWIRADRYTPGPAASSGSDTPPKATRPQPIRDAILAFLVEPKSAKEIALHIDRPVPVATGHLRAMRVRNLVVRISWGVWVRRDCCADAPDPSTIRRNFPAQEALLKHLSEPRTLDELEQVSGSPRSRIYEPLTKLVALGAVKRQPDNRYAACHK
jgi:hypothetical protein